MSKNKKKKLKKKEKQKQKMLEITHQEIQVRFDFYVNIRRIFRETFLRMQKNRNKIF